MPKAFKPTENSSGGVQWEQARQGEGRGRHIGAWYGDHFGKQSSWETKLLWFISPRFCCLQGKCPCQSLDSLHSHRRAEMMSHRLLSHNYTAELGEVSHACKALATPTPSPVSGASMCVYFKSHGKAPSIFHWWKWDVMWHKVYKKWINPNFDKHCLQASLHSAIWAHAGRAEAHPVVLGT